MAKWANPSKEVRRGVEPAPVVMPVIQPVRAPVQVPEMVPVRQR